MFDRVVVEKVSKIYGHERALAGVSLTLEPGKVTLLLGPNGAGKSTLIGVLSTLVRPTSGKVVFGDNLAPERVRGGIGLLAHDALVYGELTAVENLELYGALYDVADTKTRAAALLDEVGLDAKARARAARTYSRGMLQRLALARALLPSPKLLLLDEPFTGLDRAGMRGLAAALGRARADGRIVVVTTHELEAVGGLCDQLAILRNGKLVLVEGGPFSVDDLKEKYERATG
jgi:ABC-type multidrug transport system ATPase subunit